MFSNHETGFLRNVSCMAVPGVRLHRFLESDMTLCQRRLARTFCFLCQRGHLSSVLLLLQHAKGEEGESNGALAAPSPRIKLLQEKLGIIEGTYSRTRR